MQNYSIRWWGVRAVFEVTETILCSLLRNSSTASNKEEESGFLKMLISLQ